MKKKIILPFALTGLVSALVACGGGSSNVNEDPYTNGITNTTSGCSYNSSGDSCQQFNIDYPIAGLNFDCSSDSQNHFATTLTGNIVTGGCKKGDKVTFYIQGNSDKKIELGTVNLANLNAAPVASANAYTQIGLLDIATAMTGTKAQSMNVSDPTYKVYTQLVRLFQAVSAKSDRTLAQEIQAVTLTQDYKNDLIRITKSVKAIDFSSDVFMETLKPWIDIASIIPDTEQNKAVADKLMYQNTAGIYTADWLSLIGVNQNLALATEGFHGKSSSNSEKEMIGNMYLLTDRSGYTSGYGLEWIGKPTLPSEATNTSLGRVFLISQVAPQKMSVFSAQQNWLNPITQSLNTKTPFKMSTVNDSTNILNLTNGQLLNNSIIAGTNTLYKSATNTTIEPADKSVLGAWNQTINGESFSGSIDVYKTDPISYLDRNVFKTKANTASGNYIFPLYATLEFKFSDTSEAPVKLGIVINENGDIRTDIAPNAPETDMSGTCAAAKADTMLDSNSIQQYRLGTIGATNNQVASADQSITLRMILSHPNLKRLDGILMGLNSSIASSTGSASSLYSVSGLKINLYDLISNNRNNINLTDFNGNSAQWANLHAAYQKIFNNTDIGKQQATDAQKAIAKRTDGTVSIKLANCYKVNPSASFL